MQQKYTPGGHRKQEYSLAMRISDSLYHQFDSRCSRQSRYGPLFAFDIALVQDTKVSINFDTGVFSRCIAVPEFMQDM